INKFLLDAVPEGDILILHNYDKPGVIGEVGTLLGTKEINIARLHLGREAVGGEAVSLWSIDTPPVEEIIKELIDLPHIISVRLVKL
ncbi:MAG: ACT domain-containing protein, partial [Thermodesulfobacteriota bacterium]